MSSLGARHSSGAITVHEKTRHWSGAPPAYFFSMFQKIVTGDSTLPLTFLRKAAG